MRRGRHDLQADSHKSSRQAAKGIIYRDDALVPDHRKMVESSFSVIKVTLRRYTRRDRSSPPASSQRVRFLHWLTSNSRRTVQPSTTASTPTPVTRTQPRTDRCFSFRRWRPIERKELSETAEPQKDSLREVRAGQPREITSVAVSERAQQNDCDVGFG